MLLFLPLLLQAQAIEAPAPLQPIGKWNVEYANESCLLTRDFGSADQPITLGFRPIGVSGVDSFELILTGPGDGAQVVGTGQARVAFQPNAQPVVGKFESWNEVERKRRITAIDLYVPKLGDQANVQTLTIAVGKRAPISLAAKGLTTAIAALSKCHGDLIRSWNVDANQNASLKRRAKAIGSPADWYLPGDYPPSARNNDVSGRARLLLIIAPNGRVSDCHVLRNSGVPSLDNVSCAASKARARYQPALDVKGMAVASYDVMGVNWQLLEF